MAYMPGQILKVITPTICDDCDKPATNKVVGETDSFGSEFHYLCDEHTAEMKEAIRNQTGICDSCSKESTLLNYRDPDEGSNGPVYQYCSDCHTTIKNRWYQDNISEYDEDDDDYDC